MNDISDRAKQQKKSLEKVNKITEFWDKKCSFQFKQYKAKEIHIFVSVTEVMDCLTNDQTEISTLLSKKFMAP